MLHLKIVNSKYSRVLVFDHDIEHILGVVHVKDMMDYVVKNDLKTLDLKTLLRDTYYVPKDIKISKLFKDMQTNNQHIALLIDDHGGFDGIVTLEDIIEEIVGNIYDEHDLIDKQIEKINDQTYIINANTHIRDINRHLKLSLEEKNKKYHSISGLYIFLLGHIPDKDYHKEIAYKNVKLDIDSFKDENIAKIMLKIVK